MEVSTNESREMGM